MIVTAPDWTGPFEEDKNVKKKQKHFPENFQDRRVDMGKTKTGVVLARMQPIHNGHLALIEKACSENDEVFVFVGSADKFNVRNPIPISVRMDLVKAATKVLSDTYKNLTIVPLDDLSVESDNSHDWGFYLYTKIVTTTGNPNFTIYYSDGFEIITTWFPGFVLRNNVSLSLLARNSVEGGVSATAVRNMIVNNDDENLKENVPACVYDMRDSLRRYIELSKMVR